MRPARESTSRFDHAQVPLLFTALCEPRLTPRLRVAAARRYEILSDDDVRRDYDRGVGKFAVRNILRHRTRRPS